MDQDDQSKILEIAMWLLGQEPEQMKRWGDDLYRMHQTLEESPDRAPAPPPEDGGIQMSIGSNQGQVTFRGSRIETVNIYLGERG